MRSQKTDFCSLPEEGEGGFHEGVAIAGSEAGVCGRGDLEVREIGAVLAVAGDVEVEHLFFRAGFEFLDFQCEIHGERRSATLVPVWPFESTSGL
jgi:hypothetical protein